MQRAGERRPQGYPDAFPGSPQHRQGRLDELSALQEQGETKWSSQEGWSPRIVPLCV